MKHNVNEMKAREWLLAKGLAKTDEDCATVFPDIYVISTAKFYEVKSLKSLRYGKKYIYLSYEQCAQFKKLNPEILVFEHGTDEPVWQGSFQKLIKQLPSLPFRLVKQHRSQ